MTKPTLVLACIAACLFSAVMMCARPAGASDFLYTNTPDGGCLQIGADAGNSVKLAISPNSQFMVTTTQQVQYRSCTSSTCVALPTDAPIAATSAGEDLCQKTGYPYVSFYALYDGGVPTVCVYGVNPKTVCSINAP